MGKETTLSNHKAGRDTARDKVQLKKKEKYQSDLHVSKLAAGVTSSAVLVAEFYLKISQKYQCSLRIC